MNTRASFHIALSLIAALVLSTIPAHSAESGNSLDVIIHDTVLPSPMGGGWTREDSRNSRYVTLQQVVREVLRNRGFDGRLNFMRWGANLPDNPAQLFITVERWEEAPYSRGRMLSVDFVMAVRLRLDGEDINLGRFTGRDSHIVIGSGDTVRDFGGAARKALEQAADFYNNSVTLQLAD